MFIWTGVAPLFEWIVAISYSDIRSTLGVWQKYVFSDWKRKSCLFFWINITWKNWHKRLTFKSTVQYANAKSPPYSMIYIHMHIFGSSKLSKKHPCWKCWRLNWDFSHEPGCQEGRKRADRKRTWIGILKSVNIFFLLQTLAAVDRVKIILTHPGNSKHSGIKPYDIFSYFYQL